MRRHHQDRRHACRPEGALRRQGARLPGAGHERRLKPALPLRQRWRRRARLAAAVALLQRRVHVGQRRCAEPPVRVACAGGQRPDLSAMAAVCRLLLCCQAHHRPEPAAQQARKVVCRCATRLGAASHCRGTRGSACFSASQLSRPREQSYMQAHAPGGRAGGPGRAAARRVPKRKDVAQAVAAALLGAQRLGRHAGGRVQQLALIDEGHLPARPYSLAARSPPGSRPCPAAACSERTAVQ